MSEKETKKKMDDVEELKGILGTVSEQVPKIIRGIIDSFFSPEAGANLGKAVAEFYKNLKEAGIPPDEALTMAKDYLGTLTKWSEVLKGLKDVNFGQKKIEVRKEKKEEEKEE